MNKNDNVGKAVNVTEIKIITIIKTKTKKKLNMFVFVMMAALE